jgi:hypothetical protein
MVIRKIFIHLAAAPPMSTNRKTQENTTTRQKLPHTNNKAWKITYHGETHLELSTKPLNLKPTGPTVLQEPKNIGNGKN